MSKEPYEKLDALEGELYSKVEPLNPLPLYWLDSDATYSYCLPCARKARWEEMGNAGPPPFELGWYRSDPVEDNIRSGIDGGFDSSPSDSPQSCETCSCTLHHTLTEYGVESELAHFAEHPGFTSVGPEDSYTISRICLNLTWPGANPEQVAAAIVIVESALAAIKETPTNG